MADYLPVQWGWALEDLTAASLVLANRGAFPGTGDNDRITYASAVTQGSKMQIAVARGLREEVLRIHVKDTEAIRAPRVAAFDMTINHLSAQSRAHVAILMAVYHGAKWLPEQIQSIENQTHTNWFLHVSDDGVHQETSDVLNEYQKWLERRFGSRRMQVFQGPCQGFALNFLSLVCDPAIEGEYFAFCDQDDVWDENKLERALAWLDTIDPEVPALYCGRTRLINAHGHSCGASPLFSKAASFKNALVQSIAGGNTMVFNSAARRLLQCAGPVNVISHDWWVYLAISACGGGVKYDPIPMLSYRQHDDNLVGQNTTLTARIKRIVMLFRGDLRNWVERNLVALALLRRFMTAENTLILDTFILARESPLFLRIHLYWKCGLYRQTFFGKVGLCVACLTSKL